MTVEALATILESCQFYQLEAGHKTNNLCLKCCVLVTAKKYAENKQVVDVYNYNMLNSTRILIGSYL